MSDGVVIHRLDVLTPDDAAAVAELVRAAEVIDGFAALNEAAMLQLDHPDPGVTHLLAISADGVTGYGQLDRTPAGVVASLLVAPDHRWAGTGDALLTRLIGESDGRLQVWAPHNTAAAASLAECHGLAVQRRLLVMERALDGDWPPAPPPTGVEIRSFHLGEDEEAWLALNARAFAHHPEQGHLTRADLDQRLAESWFDASGFFLAVRDDDPQAVQGFHWTKRHPDRLGEVYVLGVDPTAGARGLGRALLTVGLDHLRDRGDDRVELYVESDNTAARRLYDRAGFAVVGTDVLYAAAPPTD